MPNRSKKSSRRETDTTSGGKNLIRHGSLLTWVIATINLRALKTKQQYASCPGATPLVRDYSELVGNSLVVSSFFWSRTSVPRQCSW